MHGNIGADECSSATRFSFILVFCKILAYQASVCILLASLPRALSDGGENTLIVGLAVGILAAGTVVARIACASFMNRISVRNLFIAADLMLVLAAAGYILSGATQLVMLPRMLHGAAFAFSTTAIGLWISNNASASSRGKIRGVEGALIGLCVVAAPIAGLYLQSGHRIEAVFDAIAVLAILGATIRPGGNERRITAFTSRRTETLWLPFAGLALVGAIQGVVQSFLPVIAHWKNDISLATIFVVTGAAMIAGRLGGGWCSDIVGRFPIIRLGAVGTAVSIAVLYGTDAPLLILCACAVFGAAIGAYTTGSFTHLVDVTAGRPDQGGILSGASLSWELGIFFGPAIIGLVGLSGGAPTITLACIALSGVLIAVSLSVGAASEAVTLKPATGNQPSH